MGFQPNCSYLAYMAGYTTSELKRVQECNSHVRIFPEKFDKNWTFIDFYEMNSIGLKKALCMEFKPNEI